MKQSLQPDKWYKVECCAARNQFIDRVIALHPGVVISQNAYDAQCLKYNSERNAINYRSSYHADYLGPIDTYYQVNMMEEHKMNNCPETSAPYWERDPMIHAYYSRKLEELTSELEKKQMEVILQTEVGASAFDYICSFEAAKGQKCPFSLIDLAPVHLLSKTEYTVYQSLEGWYDLQLAELKRHCNEAEYLLKQADCFAAKQTILKRYGIIVGPTKSEVAKGGNKNGK